MHIFSFEVIKSLSIVKNYVGELLIITWDYLWAWFSMASGLACLAVVVSLFLMRIHCGCARGSSQVDQLDGTARRESTESACVGVRALPPNYSRTYFCCAGRYHADRCGAEYGGGVEGMDQGSSLVVVVVVVAVRDGGPRHRAGIGGDVDNGCILVTNFC